MVQLDFADAGLIRHPNEDGLECRPDFHEFRHTFISNLVISGVSLKVVQELADHSSVQVTERYTHLQKTRLHRDAVQALGSVTIQSPPLKVVSQEEKTA